MALLEHGYSVTIIDNLDNSFPEAFRRMQELAGDKAANMKFIKVGQLSVCVVAHAFRRRRLNQARITWSSYQVSVRLSVPGTVELQGIFNVFSNLSCKSGCAGGS